jgi:dTDP-glucose 4,6-dehydratase
MNIPLEDLDYIKNYESIEWEKLRDKKIFITGASGFFGIWIVNTLVYVNSSLKLNLKLILLSRDLKKLRKKLSPIKDKFISMIEGDINDVNIIFPDCNFIIHAAASSDSINYTLHRKEMLDTLISGSLNLFEFYSKKQKKIKILNISSGGFYGDLSYNQKPIEEDENISNLNIYNESGLYSVGKIVSELYANIFSSSEHIQIINARCFAFVGPYLPLDKHFAIGNFINDVLQNKKISLSGDGSPIRSYLYMSDLVVALIILLTKGKSGESYNVGSDQPISILNLAKLINKISSNNNDVSASEVNNTSSSANYYLPNINKIKSLGFDKFCSLELSVKKTLNFYNKLN